MGNGSTFGSCWIGDFPQYPLGRAVLGAGAQGQTPNARKPPSIQSGHCKLCVGCFSHIFCKHDQGGAGDNQQTTGRDFRADQFLRDADQFLQDDKWTGEVPHRKQIWDRHLGNTTVECACSLVASVSCCPNFPSLAEEEWKRRMVVLKKGSQEMLRKAPSCLWCSDAPPKIFGGKSLIWPAGWVCWRDRIAHKLFLIRKV